MFTEIYRHKQLWRAPFSLGQVISKEKSAAQENRTKVCAFIGMLEQNIILNYTNKISEVSN